MVAGNGGDEPAGPAGVGGRLRRLARTDWKARARDVASSLKAEYEAGRRGDDGPTTPIWATPQQQLDTMLAAMHEAAERIGSSRRADEGSSDAGHDAAASAAGAQDPTDNAPAADHGAAFAQDSTDADADAVAAAIRRVDWAQVRAVTAGRTGDAAASVKAMAANVDWAAVQPAAARVSSALIAAIAAGRLPIGGPLASMVARAITDQNGLGQHVADRMQDDAPPDFRDAMLIDLDDGAAREA